MSADVADGGYLSWLYGSSVLRHQAWPPRFTGKKPLIVMDSRSTLLRKIRTPGYKSARDEKRASSVQTQERTQLVRDFRELVEAEDGRFRFVRIEGLEADDLVALAAWAYGTTVRPVKVMGIDKDFMQLMPFIRLADKDGQTVTYQKFQSRLPLALQTEPFTTPLHVILTLSLMGDKSDSIPRVLPLRNVGLNLLKDLLFKDSYPADRAAKEFGDPFLENLANVLLPDPEILGLVPGALPDLVDSWLWGPRLWKRVRKDIRKEVESWNLSPSKI